MRRLSIRIIRAVFWGIILPVARLMRAVGGDLIGYSHLYAEFCRLNLLHPMRCAHSWHRPNTTPLHRSLRLWPLLRESLCNPGAVSRSSPHSRLSSPTVSGGTPSTSLPSCMVRRSRPTGSRRTHDVGGNSATRGNRCEPGGRPRLRALFSARFVEARCPWRKSSWTCRVTLRPTVAHQFVDGSIPLCFLAACSLSLML